MKIELNSIRSKVGRRIFALFIICALIPILALSAFSFINVKNQLLRQSADRLYRTSKNTGMSLYERLLLFERKLIDLESVLSLSEVFIPIEEQNSLLRYFTGITLINGSGSRDLLIGVPLEVGGLRFPNQSHLEPDKTLLITQPIPEAPARILMIRETRRDKSSFGVLIAELNPDFMWETVSSDKLPPATEICVLDHANNILFSTIPMSGPLPQPLSNALKHSTSGDISWSNGAMDYYAGYWSIFLEPVFSIPMWTVLISEETSHTLEPIASFKRFFPLITLLSFLVILFLSLLQIKRNLVPLEQLQALTKKVSQKDFKARSHINSKDEFEELGNAFNGMSEKLGRHFNALIALSEIHRELLAAFSTHDVATITLEKINDILPSACLSFVILDPSASGKAKIYEQLGNAQKGKRVYEGRLTASEIVRLRSNPFSITITDEEDAPTYLKHLKKMGSRHFLLFPVVIKNRIAGILSLGFKDAPHHEQEDLLQTRQVVDQIGVALSNARLIEQLDALNWGTITALARAVDAKSPWTAGHTERVTALAVELGKEVGLDGVRLKNLQRGALLHDIGKIGVPVSILDKPGGLTDEEYNIVKMHPTIGARILEPIAFYSKITPIVLQHHERYDGKGYPQGLKGESMSLEARVLAVADAFDAITSDRPYRPGMEVHKGIEIILQESGRQFDPKVAETFVNMVIKQGKYAPEIFKKAAS